MLKKRFSIWFKTAACVGAVILTACNTAPPTPDETAVAQQVASQVAGQNMTSTAESDRVATSIAATLTAMPTNTATETATSTSTATKTSTPTETATSTDTPTPAATATKTAPPRPTQPPVTPTQTRAPTVYGFTAGPEGYLTDIDCFKGSAACTPTMAPGDINFTFYLLSGPEAPWTLFTRYGLSVEKDGVNVADMFMFVDAGWLPPDGGASFGASRNFTSPGRYVIRSSGCLTLDPGIPCGWNTMGGTTVTFTIQP